MLSALFSFTYLGNTWALQPPCCDYETTTWLAVPQVMLTWPCNQRVTDYISHDTPLLLSGNFAHSALSTPILTGSSAWDGGGVCLCPLYITCCQKNPDTWWHGYSTFILIIRCKTLSKCFCFSNEKRKSAPDNQVIHTYKPNYYNELPNLIKPCKQLAVLAIF